MSEQESQAPQEISNVEITNKERYLEIKQKAFKYFNNRVVSGVLHDMKAPNFYPYESNLANHDKIVLDNSLSLQQDEVAYLHDLFRQNVLLAEISQIEIAATFRMALLGFVDQQMNEVSKKYATRYECASPDWSNALREEQKTLLMTESTDSNLYVAYCNLRAKVVRGDLNEAEKQDSEKLHIYALIEKELMAAKLSQAIDMINICKSVGIADFGDFQQIFTGETPETYQSMVQKMQEAFKSLRSANGGKQYSARYSEVKAVKDNNMVEDVEIGDAVEQVQNILTERYGATLQEMDQAVVVCRGGSETINNAVCYGLGDVGSFVQEHPELVPPDEGWENASTFSAIRKGARAVIIMRENGIKKVDHDSMRLVFHEMGHALQALYEARNIKDKGDSSMPPNLFVSPLGTREIFSHLVERDISDKKYWKSLTSFFVHRFSALSLLHEKMWKQIWEMPQNTDTATLRAKIETFQHDYSEIVGKSMNLAVIGERAMSDNFNILKPFLPADYAFGAAFACYLGQQIDKGLITQEILQALSISFSQGKSMSKALQELGISWDDVIDAMRTELDMH